jgi:3',5'-cyclic AMP phosphodiesterase CpdA
MARRPGRILFSAAGVSAIAGLTLLGCRESKTSTAATRVPATTTPQELPSPPPPFEPDAVIAGAGDIAMCGAPEVAATATLLDSIPGAVFTAGDNAYPSGGLRDFISCYEPTWGRHKGRTRPVPGNHEYETPGGAGYYQYFGSIAGPAGLGYYSYREGAWLVVAINSAIATDAASPQGQWLRATLAQNSTRCTAAIWHHPLYSSGPNGDNRYMSDIWRMLEEFGADVVISGHDHIYERFAPQTVDGRRDDEKGIRQFVVGTGGAHIYDVRSRKPNSEVVGRASGVLKLTLKADSYDWQFVPVPGASFTDAGSGRCH